jgi:hypothetical protein
MMERETGPTELERAATGLFTPAPGMRIWIDWSLPHEDSWGDGVWVRVREDGTWCDTATTIPDTDDAATVGVMVSQFDGYAVSVIDRRDVLPMPTTRLSRFRFAVITERDGAQTTTVGPTRGAALVAAKRGALQYWSCRPRPR